MCMDRSASVVREGALSPSVGGSLLGPGLTDTCSLPRASLLPVHSPPALCLSVYPVALFQAASPSPVFSCPPPQLLLGHGHSLACQQEGLQSTQNTGFPTRPWEPGEVPEGAPVWDGGRKEPWAPPPLQLERLSCAPVPCNRVPCMLLFEPRILPECKKAT